MIIDNLIWVLGNPRSGTSLLGKILASCKNCEYSYEPELLPYILGIKEYLPKKKWKQFLEGYLIEELFFNIFVGRKINLKSQEESSIANFKSKKEIDKKLSMNLSRVDLNQYLKNNNVNFIVKFPGIDIKKITKYYPKNKKVIIKRNIYEVINSLILKKWFKNQKNLIESFLPFKMIKNKKYPYWFDKRYLKIWEKSNEITRCAIFVLISEEYLKNIKNTHVINYEDLVLRPKNSMKRLTKSLNLKMTSHTQALIKKVKKKTRLVNKQNIRNRINPIILKKLMKYE